ncbi:MAG: NDP-hexose 2,3-dehydratase family protein [Flavobacteriales bacterium]|nr:NDP-hexose 2,3-dehydratase family protein [Flavobacteriales bacterium]
MDSTKFLKSALTISNPIISTEGVLQWLQEKNTKCNIEVNRVPFSELKNWYFDEPLGYLRHQSGKFFSIVGIDVKTNFSTIPNWQQPIIHQPEIGFLGIITKELNGILCFLMQAKVEPGNVVKVQLSPTLQATKSNYTQIHEGKKPRYLSFFQNAMEDQILLDELLSEQGARFLKKKNRNIIIQVEEEIEEHEDFVWLTLGQLKELSEKDNVLNMDARTVISSIDVGDVGEDLKQACRNISNDKTNRRFLNGVFETELNIDSVLLWLTQLKSEFELDVTLTSLKSIDDWIVEDDRIRHVDNKYFQIIGIDVQLEGREVKQWCQPIIKPMQPGLCAFVVKKVGDVYHFLVQAKLECGNVDIVELAPTVQCLTGGFQNEKSLWDIPFLKEILEASTSQILIDVNLSEEGGRFYKESNRHMIVELEEELLPALPETFKWISLKQLLFLLKINNILNVQARSLISLISYH